MKQWFYFVNYATNAPAPVGEVIGGSMTITCDYEINDSEGYQKAIEEVRRVSGYPKLGINSMSLLGTKEVPE